MRKLFILSILLLTGCFEGENGSQGSNGAIGLKGSEGLNYYSYLETGRVSEIVGEGLRERFEASDGDYYQLPSKFTVVVDNTYASRPDCSLQDLNIIFDTGERQFKFTFQASENRYRMIYKSGPLDKVIDSSRLSVYYENSPKVICPEGEYELHSEISFEVRVIEELKVE